MKYFMRLKNIIYRKTHHLKIHSRLFYHNLFYRTITNFCLNFRINKTKDVDELMSFNTNLKREIEIKEEDYSLTEVVLACYFIKKANPQSGEQQKKANFEFIKPWYNSINKLKINGIIIHDGLDQNFITKHTTEFVKFRKFTQGNNNVLDERWLFYYYFISKTNIKKAFCTDISDVKIKKDPFNFIKKKTLYIGRDNANKIRLSGWMLEEMNNLKKAVKIPSNFIYQSVYNVGIVGGDRKMLLFTLSKFCDLFLKVNSSDFHEMTLFNLIIYKYIPVKFSWKANEPIEVDNLKDNIAKSKFVFSGLPLNNAFKSFNEDLDVIFIHK